MSMLKKYLMEDIYLQKKGNKIIDKLRLKQYNNGISKNRKKNNSKTVTNKNDKEIPKEMPKERHVSQEARQKIINNLKSIMIV